MDKNIYPLIRSLEAFLESKWGNIIITFVLIPLFIIAALLLPPISLVQRITSFDYTSISSEGGTLTDPDGTAVTLLPEGMKGGVRIKLLPVPRSKFLEGSAGGDLIQAAQNIPANLIMKSPYYSFSFRGNEPKSVIITIPIPNESEPYQTLDLYTWNGKTWEFVPNQLIVSDHVIEATLDYMPDSLVVMQTKPIYPAVSADIAASVPVPAEAKDTVVEINPQGLYLSSDGSIEGDSGTLPVADQQAKYIIIPTIRNWDEGGSVRSDLIDNMLIDEEAQKKHIQEIVDLTLKNGYAGIDLDYRGANPELKAEFTNFIKNLAEALHQHQKQLSLHVSEPAQVAENLFDTGVYDWKALGQVVDSIKMPTPADPRAYAAGGHMEALLTWAVGQVSRYKLQLRITTLSTEVVNGTQRNLTYEQALAPFGQIGAVGVEGNTVIPGQQVTFTLKGFPASTGIQFDSASGTYWYAYLAQDGAQHTIYLENAASIARKLQFVAQYNLRGVAVENLLGTKTEAQVWEVIRKFLELIIPPVESKYGIVWTITSSSGGLLKADNTDLTNPNYTWTAPEEGGEYKISAVISGDKNAATGVDRGSISLKVATPTPTPPPTPTPEPTKAPEAKPAAPAAKPTKEAAPASAVGNLPFDYGIQVDAMGNIAANTGHVKQMGFHWIKVQMPWKDVEPSQGNYNWGMWDSLVNNYNASGIKVLLSIPKAPKWARPANSDFGVEGPPSDPATYGSFVGAVAARYKGKVQAIEVWNEQNMDYEWGRETLDPARYMGLLKAAYTSIKAADPGMIVVSGALTPTGAPPPVAMDDAEYLRQMYANGLKQYCDAVGAHPSGFANPPDALYQGGDYDPSRGYDDHRSFFFRNTMEAYHQIMADNGDGGKTVWPTEFGWPVWRYQGDARFVYAVNTSLDQQAKWTVQAYQMAKAWGWVGTMFLWNLDYTSGELSNFSIYPGGPTPAYNALVSMAK